MEANEKPGEKPRHGQYICSFADCTARYNKQWKLDQHLCRHTGVRPFSCAHGGCAKSFTSNYHLARHALIHSGERPFACTADGCGQAFTTGANMRRHVARKHTVYDADAIADRTRTYSCDVSGCTRVFRKNKQLKLHVCEEHTGAPPYCCSEDGCSLRFTCASKLRRHEKVHAGYQCQEEACVFKGKTWTELLKHRKEAHRRVYTCDRCERVFRDSWFLRQHQRVHSEVREVLKCPREGCGRSFTTSFNLTSHVRSFHEDLRPFACDHVGCGKTFAMKSSLQRHNVAHDPERRSVQRPRPSLSLASRLSGYRTRSRAGRTRGLEEDDDAVACPEPQEQQEQIQLVSLLQDTALLIHSLDQGDSPMAMTTS